MTAQTFPLHIKVGNNDGQWIENVEYFEVATDGVWLQLDGQEDQFIEDAIVGGGGYS